MRRGPFAGRAARASGACGREHPVDPGRAARAFRWRERRSRPRSGRWARSMNTRPPWTCSPARVPPSLAMRSRWSWAVGATASRSSSTGHGSTPRRCTHSRIASARESESAHFTNLPDGGQPIGDPRSGRRRVGASAFDRGAKASRARGARVAAHAHHRGSRNRKDKDGRGSPEGDGMARVADGRARDSRPYWQGGTEGLPTQSRSAWRSRTIWPMQGSARWRRSRRLCIDFSGGRHREGASHGMRTTRCRTESSSSTKRR